MKKIILFNTLCILLVACGEQEGQTGRSAPRPEYRTTAPSLLYFKNMRSTYYEQSEQPGTRVELYRLRKFSQSATVPMLVPLIANNWLKDEAYLLLEPADARQVYAMPLTIRWNLQDDSGFYRLQPATVAQQQELALQVYKSLQADYKLEILAADSTWAPILADRNNRNHYLTTVRDYLRLTEAL